MNVDAWFLSKARGEGLTLDDWDTFIGQAHQSIPGLTPLMMEEARDHDGRNSYDILAGAAAGYIAPQPSVVVDLAAGRCTASNALLGLVSRSDFITVLAVDRSIHELAHVVPRPGLITLEADVHDLPIPSDSVDVVICHLGLMLFRQPQLVVNEVRRVLRPGGTFLAVVPRGFPQPDFGHESARQTASAVIWDFLTELVGSAPPLPPQFDLSALISHFDRDGKTEVRSFPVSRWLSSEDYWSTYVEPLYLVWFLPDDRRSALRDRVLRTLRRHESKSGEVCWDLSLELLIHETPPK